MQVKTINRVISKKLAEWLDSITDKQLALKVKDSLLVSGGCIASLFHKKPVNDFDIYIQDMDVLVKLVKYYCGDDYLDGRLKEKYLSEVSIANKYSLETNLSKQVIRIKTLHADQVKLNIPSEGIKKELIQDEKNGKPIPYQVAFLSQNAISLTDNIQIVTRFSGTPEEIHKNFDFIHATNYFTFSTGLVTNTKALESLLTMQLQYQGSLYPLTSIIRMKKFILRGWAINAGEILKIMFQLSALDLTDIEVLEDQLVGVDIAYFSKLIEVIREGNIPKEKMISSYLNEIIDRVFNEYEEDSELLKDIE